MAAGTCRYCGCTEDKPCEGGCAWADALKTLCDVCAPAVETARELVRVFGLTAADPMGGLQMAVPSFEALPLKQQTTVVMTCRAIVDQIEASILEDLTVEISNARLELAQIGTFLVEQCPDELRDDETLAETTMRLLEPHVGSRIVRPDQVVRR